MEGDAVAPEGSARLEEALAERAGELAERAPAGGFDLLSGARGDLLVGAGRQEDVCSPRHLVRLEEKAGFGDDEVALQLDPQAGLFERLAPDAFDEVLAGLDATAGRSPDPGLELRLADQREAVAVEDEERHVVHPLRVVGREGMLPLADLAFPLEESRLSVPLSQRLEDGFRHVHGFRLPNRCLLTRLRWRSWGCSRRRTGASSWASSTRSVAGSRRCSRAC